MARAAWPAGAFARVVRPCARAVCPCARVACPWCGVQWCRLGLCGRASPGQCLHTCLYESYRDLQTFQDETCLHTRLYVCPRTCPQACLRTCLHTGPYTWPCTRLCTGPHACLRACLCACVPTCVPTCLPTAPHTYVYTLVYTHVYHTHATCRGLPIFQDEMHSVLASRSHPPPQLICHN